MHVYTVMQGKAQREQLQAGEQETNPYQSPHMRATFMAMLWVIVSALRLCLMAGNPSNHDKNASMSRLKERKTPTNCQVLFTSADARFLIDSGPRPGMVDRSLRIG